MKFLLKNIVLVLFSLISVVSFGQLEKVIVERYYVSDVNDATDQLGGGVEAGSTTYRIYVDLAPGTVLKSIYGDTLHPFEVNSTSVFFNNIADGQTFAKEFIRNRYLENTVALDTWLTLGQTAKKQGEVAYYGILKDQDDDGTFIGGVNNDGGSEMIASGLLINEDPSCGLPLTTADGMDTLHTAPTNWFSNGLLDFLTGNDSTIFGSINAGTSFYSQNFSLSSSGVMGTIPDSNQVIVAQLTTLGELSFRLNVEVEYVVDGIAITKKYVGTNNVVSPDQEFSPYLSYPYSCGCNDAAYIEFDPTVICYEPGSCATPIVLGCMDHIACNYDVNANQHVEELCCYPGWCNNRNIEEVCPVLMGDSFDFSIYPNPAGNQINLNVITGVIGTISYTIYDSYGSEVMSSTLSGDALNYSGSIDLAMLNPGVYQLHVSKNNQSQHKLFVKL